MCVDGRTIYWAAPNKDFAFNVGDVLEVATVAGEALAKYFLDGRRVGYTEGDCALGLRERKVERVRVIDVGKISGFGCCVAIDASGNEILRPGRGRTKQTV